MLQLLNIPVSVGMQTRYTCLRSNTFKKEEKKKDFHMATLTMYKTVREWGPKEVSCEYGVKGHNYHNNRKGK